MASVLVIEDESILCDALVVMLRSEGFEAVGANNGLTALRLLEEHTPDIVVSDISMPQLDGYAVLSRLRSNPVTRDIPLIFLTAKTQRRDVRYGMELGAADYLTKPFAPEELVASVRTQLTKKEELTAKYENQFKELVHNIIYSLPHELRTPLVGIQGFANLLQMNYQSATPSEILHAAETILSSSQRLSHLIENYLVYAQLELISSNPAKIAEMRQQETENVQHVILETAIAAAAGCRREADLDIHLQGDSSLPIGQADLQKVITELVDNACKFSDPGTPITIRGYVFGDRFYRITIHDQGRGMTEEQVSQVGAYMQFERKLYEQQGLGLGLAIARQIIRFYNGECHVHSIYERETSLTVDLPLWQPPQN